MLPVVALLGAPHGPLFTARAQALGHADLRGGLRLLAVLGFLSRSLMLLIPGGLDTRLDGGEGQQGSFHTGGHVQDIVRSQATVEEHLAQQAGLFFLRYHAWALQVRVALERVHSRPDGFAVLAAEALPDLGGVGVKALAHDLAGAAHWATPATGVHIGFRAHEG
jgi:hypothetical protein